MTAYFFLCGKHEEISGPAPAFRGFFFGLGSSRCYKHRGFGSYLLADMVILAFAQDVHSVGRPASVLFSSRVSDTIKTTGDDFRR